MEEATLSELKQRLREEEDVYAEFLAKLDGLSSRSREGGPSLETLQKNLNESRALSHTDPTASPSGLKGLLRSLFRKLIGPELANIQGELSEQRAFNSSLVQWVNSFSQSQQQASSLNAEFASALVGFAQRIDRLADAKDRLYASLGNTRSDLMLEAMDKRLEHMRLNLKSAQETLNGMGTHLSLARAELAALRPTPTGAPATRNATPPNPTSPSVFREEHYIAFQDRYRGSRDEVREHLKLYVSRLRTHVPVVELGCGRGEFLELLRDENSTAKGIDDNASMVELCRERNLDVEQQDLVPYLNSLEAETVGGLFSAQVVEHLAPSVLRQVLSDCHRALVPGGLLVLETVNPRSVVALIESFYRDLTHEKPIHPETLEFLLTAAGFEKVEIVYRSPVSHRSKLLPVGGGGNDPLSQNFEKLNGFLYGELDYAAIATKHKD